MQNTAFFGSLDPHRRDLCAAVLALCAPDFEEKPAPAPEFLSALYQKLCAQMFPDGLPEIPTLTADEMAYLTALEAALANRRDGFDPYLDRLPLPEGALAGSRVEAQYARFEQAVRESHLLAVMRLGMEATPFDPALHCIRLSLQKRPASRLTCRWSARRRWDTISENSAAGVRT